jgi:predicted DNA-binding transcriptional regulator AlpA
LALGHALKRVWWAPTTTPRDRTELRRALLEAVSIAVFRDDARAQLTLRGRGGRLTALDVSLPRSRPATVRTDDDTLARLRRLAAHYPDDGIAGSLNRQGRTTARGLRFTANRVGNTRRHGHIPRFQPRPDGPAGELLSIQQAAKALNLAPSTLYRWVNDGFVAGEQGTPGAPWQIRLTDDLRRQFGEEAPEGYVVMQAMTTLLGVSRQPVLQRVKRGELEAVHVCRGRRKGLRLKVIDNHPDLFNLSP